MKIWMAVPFRDAVNCEISLLSHVALKEDRKRVLIRQKCCKREAK